MSASTISPTHGTVTSPCRSSYHTPYVLGQPARQATQRFFERALRSDMESCIMWPFAKDGDGYAKMRYGGASSVVSRLVCEFVSGPAPDELHQAAHSCGRTSCINHRHLSWKTPIENSADKIAHGTNQLGEANSGAKLTVELVRSIRALAKFQSQRVVAKTFGISRSTAWAIINRKKWSHVE